MRFTVLAVGGKMPAWVTEGVEQYQKRLPRDLQLEWRDIPLARRGKDAKPDQLRAQEGEQLIKAIPRGDHVIALDVRGKSLDTARLARYLRDWQMSGDNISVLIGGPDGLSPECLQRANQRWSLSDLTLPHPLVRVLLSEQLYRAWTITVNHPYHRD